MLKDFLTDRWTYIGSAATTLMLVMQWIATNLNPILAFLAGVGGLVLVVFGIKEKYEKYRLAQKENTLKDLEIERERAEIERWRSNQ